MVFKSAIRNICECEEDISKEMILHTGQKIYTVYVYVAHMYFQTGHDGMRSEVR
jgi:hypothetical protein